MDGFGWNNQTNCSAKTSHRAPLTSNSCFKKHRVGGTSPLKLCWEYAPRASVGVSLCLCCGEVTALHSHKCLTLW